MKSKMLFTLAILALICFSCKKKSTESTSSSEPDFTQLKVGNYWVYKVYKVDTNGVETDQNKTDSSYILKDTLINGIQYFVKISSSFPFSRSTNPLMPPDTTCLRDSAGYLLERTWNGGSLIVFARDNFTDVFLSDSIDNLALRQIKMTGKDSVVNVPAGTFTTRSLCLILYPLHPDYPWGIRRFFYIYGSGVGQIKFTFGFYSEPGHYEAQLVRYHIGKP